MIVEFIQKSEESGICTAIWKKTCQIGECILSDITRYYKSINGAKKDQLNSKLSRSMQNQTHTSVRKVTVSLLKETTASSLKGAGLITYR